LVCYHHHQRHNQILTTSLYYYLIYLKLSTVSMDFKLVLEEGDRVKWLTPGFKIGCGVVVSMSVTGDGTIVYGIQADGGRVVHLPHSCVMRD
jgi:aminoglycoside phosphotransferase